MCKYLCTYFSTHPPLPSFDYSKTDSWAGEYSSGKREIISICSVSISGSDNLKDFLLIYLILHIYSDYTCEYYKGITGKDN